MKVILFTDSLGAGGAQRQMVGLAKLLKEKGYYITVCTYHNIDFYKAQLDEVGVPNVVVEGAANKFSRIFKIRKFFNSIQPDCVIAYQESPSLIAAIIKAMGAKWQLITSERNTSQRYTISEKLRFFFYHFAKYIVPNSYSQEKFIVKQKPSLAPKIKTITNFVDLDFFSPIGCETNEHGKKEIVVAATVWPPKNALGFIKAVKILSERTHNFHITWYGLNQGELTPYQNECNKLIKELGIEEYIELMPKVKNIRDKYREADIFCLPSFYEGTPNVICEAIACGLPIVCSDVCDNAIYVKENVNGWLFDPTLPADMANKLQKAIICEPDKLKTYSEQSRMIAENALSPEKFVQKYIELMK